MKKDLQLAYGIVKNWSSYVFGFPSPVPIGYLIIGVTYLCNLHCRMCNIHSFHREKCNRQNKELDLVVMLRSLKKSALLKKIRHIDLTGGEPFLKEGITDFIIGLFGLANIKEISINTNGALTEEIASCCEAVLRELKEDERFSVSISIDGIGEVHDKIRGASGTFSKVENTLVFLKNLKKRYPNFIIRSNAVMQRDNIDFLDKLKEFWHSHNLEGAFSMIQAPFYTSKRDSLDNVGGFTKEQIEKIKTANPKSRGTNYYLNNNFRRPLHCFAGHSSMFIDPLGDVYPCNFLATNKDYCMGNIANETIDNIWSCSASGVRKKVKRCPYTDCWNGCEVEQTIIQFEAIERVIKALSFGFLSYYKMKGLGKFE